MTNNILSIKKYIPNTDPIFPIAKEKFVELAHRLEKGKLISRYEIQAEEGLKITFYSNLDNKQVSFEISDSGEVFFRIFDKIYLHCASAYEMVDKINILDSLSEEAELWLKDRDYYEEFYEQNRKVVYRRIIFPNGASESASLVPFGWLRRFFGARKRIVRPE